MADSIIGFECFNEILKCKHINRVALTKNFHHLDNFFRTIIEALTMTLCIYVAGCQIINTFQELLGSSNWPIFIAKVKAEYLEIFKVLSICIKASKQTKNAVVVALAEKKAKWASTISLPPELNWVAIEKQLVLNLSRKHCDVVQENALLLLSYGLLYLDFVDACQKGYNG